MDTPIRTSFYVSLPLLVVVFPEKDKSFNSIGRRCCRRYALLGSSITFKARNRGYLSGRGDCGLLEKKTRPYRATRTKAATIAQLSDASASSIYLLCRNPVTSSGSACLAFSSP